MYTEVVAGFSLKKDTPRAVVLALRTIVNGEDFDDAILDHPLFACERWRRVASCSSESFGYSDSASKMHMNMLGTHWIVSIRSSLKNYGGEVEQFFDFVRPWVESGSGSRELIGYSMYENADAPDLYFVDVVEV